MKMTKVFFKKNKTYGWAFEEAQIIFSNFSGKAGTYNAEGKRNFCIVIDDPNDADILREDGYNVKAMRPRDEGDEPDHYLKVNLKLPADIYMVTRKARVHITENTVDTLDNADIAFADIVIRPYEYDPGKKSAWLQEGEINIEESYFADKYARYNEAMVDEEDLPF